MKNFWNYIFVGATIISSIGLIFIIYARSILNRTSRLLIITLLLVIAYLMSHLVHFVIMPTKDVILFDKSCHSLLLMILLSLTFLTFNYPTPSKLRVSTGLFLIIPTTIILILIWKDLLIEESYIHGEHFKAHFTEYYVLYILWYLLLISLSFISILLKHKKNDDTILRKQLLLFLFGLIITNITTFIFGIFLPWILGFYYLVEISPLAFLAGIISFTALSIGKYNMFPYALEKVHNFGLNKKIFFTALVIIPVIILLIQIPISKIIFNITSHNELIKLFLHSLFIGLIVSISLSFIISKIIAHPISVLKEKVLQIKNGKYDIELNLVSNDEIGELSRTINSMAKTLYKNQRELIQREERISILLNAFEKSLTAIALVDNDLNVVEANSQFYKLTGFSNSKVESKKIDDIQFKNNKDLFKQIINDVNRTGIYIGEIKVIDESNVSRDLLISVSKIISNNIQKGYLFVEIDITDKKMLEAKIIQSEKLAALGKMSTILAHEIKTPLTSIKMNIDMLAQTLQLNDEERVSFEIIKKETDRLARLVKEVLQFSRTSELQLNNANLNELIEEVIQLIKSNSKNKQINFIKNVPNIDLNLDRDKIKQVLLNLIQNSVDAIESEGEIQVYSVADESHIKIYIKDNGSGIEAPEKIFEPFFTTKASGTGLGLSVAQKIIEQHNGTLNLISSRKGETIFEIKLPISN